LIIALILIGVACALFFFLFKPGFENLEALKTAVAKAEDKQQEYSNVIAQGQGASEQIAEAIASYDEAKKRLFPQMLSEAIDSTVTGYIVKAGFEPQSLSLSTLTPESPTAFIPAVLNPERQNFENAEAPAEPAEPAEPADETAGGDEGSVTGAFLWDGSPFLTAYAADEENADDPAASGEEPAEGVEPISGDAPSGEAETTETGGSIYSYSVSVTVGGSISNLYKLLSIVSEVDGMDILQYSLPNKSEEAAQNADDEKTSFSFVIKLYVFVEEDVQYVSPEVEATIDMIEGTAE
jgi:hypothetical protein